MDLKEYILKRKAQTIVQKYLISILKHPRSWMD